MTKPDVVVPHYWALIDVLPVAVLYKEQAKKAVFANQAALQLLALPATQAILSLSDLQQLPLCCPSSGQPFSLLDNPLLLALSGSELQQPFYLLLNLAVGGNFTDAAANSQVSAPLPAKSTYTQGVSAGKWSSWS